MFDELNTGVEQQEQVTQEQPVAEQQAEQSKRDRNTQNLRERAEAAERRAADLERMVQANMSQQQAPKVEVEEDDFDISDDTYIEGKHLKKYVKSLRQELKNNKKQFEQYNQQSELTNAEIRLKSQFNDFENIVNEENLKRLEYEKPSLYRTILSSNNLYDKGYAAYELIKHSGIVNNKYEDVDKKIEDNKSKPRSASNASPQQGQTPLGQVGDYDRRVLTEDRKKEILKQSLIYSGRG